MTCRRYARCGPININYIVATGVCTLDLIKFYSQFADRSKMFKTWKLSNIMMYMYAFIKKNVLKNNSFSCKIMQNFLTTLITGITL